MNEMWRIKNSEKEMNKQRIFSNCKAGSSKNLIRWEIFQKAIKEKWKKKKVNVQINRIK